MTRAHSPSCPLASNSGALPKPVFGIGDRVKFDFKVPCDKAFYWRSLVRHEIREIRKVSQQRPMHPHNKSQIRDKLRIVSESECIEIAGVAPRFGHNFGHVAHECYLPGIHGAASPLSYAYYLCFRWRSAEGHNLAYIPKLGIVAANALALSDR